MVDRRRHLHLDPLGGLAGDMFAAALLDAFPELEPVLLESLESSALGDLVSLETGAAENGGITGRRLAFRPRGTDAQSHRDFASILSFLEAARLPGGVLARSKAIFTILAEAEARVHGVPCERVVFHEVGAWDSIADIVSAAILIEALDADWSCGPLPLGSGRVETDHGHLPIPAPATAYLLEGFVVCDDGVPGERVTPTGAAILRHLEPASAPPSGAVRLRGSGHGLGSRCLPGLSNLLRVLVLEPSDPAVRQEELIVCEFEVDDQSAEDLAVALDSLRAETGVRDVVQMPVFGKKGRLATQIRVLVEPPHFDTLSDACFFETATLGLRSHRVQRRSLPRRVSTQSVEDRRVAVKHALRPDGRWTAKAEMDHLRSSATGYSGRETLRRLAESTSDPPRNARDEP